MMEEQKEPTGRGPDKKPRKKREASPITFFQVMVLKDTDGNEVKAFVPVKGLLCSKEREVSTVLKSIGKDAVTASGGKLRVVWGRMMGSSTLSVSEEIVIE